MKSILIVTGLLLAATSAHADTNWQAELAQYQQEMSQASDMDVIGNYYMKAGESTILCSLDVAITGAVFVAETAPVTNDAVQLIASYPNFDQDLKDFFTWAALTNVTRGTVGGGVVAVTDTLQFIYLWLGGDTTQSYQELAETYASTINTADSLFAQQGECMMSLSETMIAATELQKRGIQTAPTPPPAYLIQR